MRILMVTDAWRPQINGVVHTLERLSETLLDYGAETRFLTPERFRTLPLPTYTASSTPSNGCRKRFSTTAPRPAS